MVKIKDLVFKPQTNKKSQNPDQKYIFSRMITEDSCKNRNLKKHFYYFLSWYCCKYFCFTGVKGTYFFLVVTVFLVVGLLIVFKNDQEDKVINVVLNVFFYR